MLKLLNKDYLYLTIMVALKELSHIIMLTEIKNLFLNPKMVLKMEMRYGFLKMEKRKKQQYMKMEIQHQQKSINQLSLLVYMMILILKGVLKL